MRLLHTAAKTHVAFDDTPATSAVTMIFGRGDVICTSKVPSLHGDLDLRRPKSSLRALSRTYPRHASKIMKSRG